MPPAPRVGTCWPSTTPSWSVAPRPLDPLLDRLSSAGVRVITSYGMTETCGGAVFDGRPLPGVQVDAEPDGRLAITGEQVALGYRDGRDPDRWSSSKRMVGAASAPTTSVGSVADGTVVVEGRADDVVQVAGASVSLGAIRAVLRGRSEGVPPRRSSPSRTRSGAVAWWRAIVPAERGAGRARTPPSPADLAGPRWRQALGRAARPRDHPPRRRSCPTLESGKVDRVAVLEWASGLDRITR